MGRLERDSVLGALGGADALHHVLADPVSAPLEHRRCPFPGSDHCLGAPGQRPVRDSYGRPAGAGPARCRSYRSVAPNTPRVFSLSAVYCLLEILGRRRAPAGLAVRAPLCRCEAQTGARPARAAEVAAAAPLPLQYTELDLGAGAGESCRRPADDRAVERSVA